MNKLHSTRDVRRGPAPCFSGGPATCSSGPFDRPATTSGTGTGSDTLYHLTLITTTPKLLFRVKSNRGSERLQFDIFTSQSPREVLKRSHQLFANACKGRTPTNVIHIKVIDFIVIVVVGRTILIKIRE